MVPPTRIAPSQPHSLLSCFPYALGQGEEGVCLLLSLGPYRILLDCGLTDLTPLQTPGTAPADAVICSHAHADHARGLYPLHESFPRLPIYASEVTTQLLSLKSLGDCPETNFCHPVAWRTPWALFENLTLELLPAGHLPGASLILLTYQLPHRTYKVLYTGDFCLSNLQLVEGLSLETVRHLRPDVLIIESSYGTRRHPHRRQQEKQFLGLIDQALQQKRSVLLPLPPLGLGQEILKLLRSHHQFTGRDVDIYVGGQLISTCDRYLELLPEFPLAVQNFAKHQPLFWDERVYPRLRPLPQATLEPGDHPVIVLTDDWEDFWQRPEVQTQAWTVLFSEDREGSALSEAEGLALQRQIPRINTDTYLLAEHSDGRNTVQFIHNVRPQHIIFVHGSVTDISDLTGLEELQSRYQLHSPTPHTLVELPIGEKFMESSLPLAANYEGEVNELASTVVITLSDRLLEDPRWSGFADTGLVEARWQGEELILRGISQRELLKQRQSTLTTDSADSCQSCRHYRHQRCWHTLSPLAGLQVPPEGFCAVFEPWDS